MDQTLKRQDSFDCLESQDDIEERIQNENVVAIETALSFVHFFQVNGRIVAKPEE